MIMLALSRRKRGRAKLDDPWIEGYEARSKYQARTCNPYRGRGDSRRLWDEGWMEAASSLDQSNAREKNPD